MKRLLTAFLLAGAIALPALAALKSGEPAPDFTAFVIAPDAHIVKTISSADDKISSEEHVTRSLAAIAEMGKAKAM